MKPTLRQLEQLIQDLEDGCISAADRHLLTELLTTDAKIRRHYCAHMAFSAAMNSKAEVEAALGNWIPENPSEPSERKLMLKSFLAAAAVVFLFAAVAGVVEMNRPNKLTMEVLAPLGTFWSMENPDGEVLKDGAPFHEGGIVVVHSGTLSLKLKSGTQMVVQGPARIKFPSEKQFKVEQGWLWVNTAKGSDQLTVESGGLRFQDIGTRFAVRSRDDGRAELHVVEGRVKVDNLHTGVAPVFAARDQGVLFQENGEMEFIGLAVDPFPGLPNLFKSHKRYGTIILGQSPVGYWQMDDSEADRILNTVAGGVEAHTGIPKNGGPNRAVEQGVSGPRPTDGFGGFGDENKGVAFKGGQDVTSVMNLGSASGVTNEEGSVSFWFKRSSEITMAETLWWAGAGYDDETEWERGISITLAASGRIKMFVESGDEDLSATSSRRVADGRWHHVVASWNLESSELYIDGSLAASDEASSSDRKKFTGFQVRFGKYGRYTNPEDVEELRLFNGSADEIALWNRALTKREAFLQFDAGVGR